MTIETLFDIGDTIWYVHRTTFEPSSTTVIAIRVSVVDTTEITYVLNAGNETRTEDQVFASQADLAAHYAPAP